MTDPQMQCPCESNKTYTACCWPYHQGESAPTAEALMRSRYSAFVIHNPKYLYKSWSKQTRSSKKDLKQKSDNEWLGLAIVRTEKGTVFDTEGVVEFIAKYRVGGKEEQLHEVSRFIRENGKWVYLDGKY